jgi:fibronectin-binding autotransporter adhesin
MSNRKNRFEWMAGIGKYITGVFAAILLVPAAGVGLLALAGTARAASNSWNVDAAGTWATGGNWLGGVNIPGSTTADNTDVATFSFTLGADRLVTVDNPRYIGGISFGNTAAYKYTLQTGTLRLNSGSVIQTLSGNGNHTDTISGPIQIDGTSGASATFTAGAASTTSLLSIGAVTGSATAGNTTTLTLNGANTGANAITGIIGNGAGGGSLALTKGDAGTWTLTGANTYTGGTTVNGGILALTYASAGTATIRGVLTVNNAEVQSGIAWALGYGGASVMVTNLTLNSGTLNFTAGGGFSGDTINMTAGTITGVAIDLYCGITYPTVNQTDTITTTGSSTSSLISNNMNLRLGTGGVIFNVADGAATDDLLISGAISSTGSQAGGTITKTGAGKLTLTGANVYTGTTTIDGGTLRISGNIKVPSSSAVINANGTLEYNTSVTHTTQSAITYTGAGVLVKSGSGQWSFGSAGNVALQQSAGGFFDVQGGEIMIGWSTVAASLSGNLGSLRVANGGTYGPNIAGSTFDSLVGDGIVGGTYGNALTLGVANNLNNVAYGVVNNTATFSGTVRNGTTSGTTSLTKTGVGTQVLSGPNAYTGSTTLSAGMLTISGSPTGNSAMIVNGGTLNLDYGTLNTSKINNSAVLTLGGGTVNLSGGTHTEIVASTTLSANTASYVTRTSGTSVLAMGGITRNAGATINFGTGGIATTTSGNDASGILGTWATVGTDYATVSGGSIIAYSGYADVTRRDSGTKVIANSAASNVRIREGTGSAGNLTLAAATTTINTLNQSTVDGTSAATIDAAGKILRLGAAGSILVATGAGSLTIGTVANSGTLTAGGTDNTAGDVAAIIDSANGAIINSVLANNGSGAVTLTKLGTGTLTLGGANTYSGTTTVSAGTLSLSGSGSSVGNLNVTGTSTLNVLGGSTVINATSGNTLFGGTSGNNASVSITGGALTIQGTGAWIALGDNGGAATLTITGGTLTNTAQFGFGLARSSSSSAGTLNVNGGTFTTSTGLYLTYANGSAGTGIVNLNGGLLVASQIQKQAAGTGTFNFNGGTLSPTASNASFMTGLTAANVQAGGAYIDDGGFAITIGQALLNSGGGLTKSGSGTLTLSNANTYTGGTIVNAGTLALNAASAIKDGTSLTINNGGNVNLIYGANNAIHGVSTLTINAGGALANTVNGTAHTLLNFLNATSVLVINGGTLAGAATANTTYGDFVINDNLNHYGSVHATGNTQSTISAGLSFNGPTTFNVDDGTAAVDLLISGRLQTATTTGGYAVLNKTGNGTLYLSNANNASNPSGALALSGVTLAAGQLIFVNGGLGNGAGGYIADFTGNSTLTWYTGNTQDISASSKLKIEDGVTATLDTGANSVSLGTAIVLGASSSGALTKIGTGTLTLTGANSYSGGTTINDGTVIAKNNAALGASSGAVSISGGATLRLDSASAQISIANNIGGNGTVEFTGNSSNRGLVTGTVSGFTGEFHVLNTGNFAAWNAAGTAPIATLNQNITIDSGGYLSLLGNAGTTSFGALNGSGTVTKNNGGGTPAILSIGNGDASGSFGGVISQTALVATGTVALNKTGTGTEVLSGATANTFTGTTTVNAGELDLSKTAGVNAIAGALTIGDGTGSDIVKLINANQLPDTTDVTINSSGLLNLNGNSETVDGLSGSGNVDGMSSTPTLTIGANNEAAGSFSGSILNTGGTLALTKTGTGTQALSGANTYGGVTTVSAGTLQFGKETALYNNVQGNWTAANLVVNAGATEAFNVGGTGEFTSGDIDTLKALGTAGGGFKSGSFIGLDTSNAGGNFAYNSVIADPNGGANALGLTKLGTGTLTLGAASTYSGATTVGAGTLSLGAANLLPDGAGKGSVTATGTLDLNTFSETINGLSGAGFVDTVAGGTPTLTVGNADATSTFSGIIKNAAGSLALTKTGDGTLTLSNANTYTGGTVVNLGTLALNAGGNNAGRIRSSLTINSGGTVNADNSWALGYGNSGQQVADITMSGGVLNFIGAANNGGTVVQTITMNGSAITGLWQWYGSLTGTPTLTTVANAGSSTISGALLLRENLTTLTLNVAEGAATDDLLISSAISSSTTAGITKTGTGQVTLSGANTYTGSTTLSAGTLRLSGSPTGNSAMNVNGGTLNLDYGTLDTSKINNSAVLTLGGGTVNLSGGTHTEVVGSTTLSANTASYVTRTSGTSVLALSTITRNTGATINFSGNGIATTTSPNDASGILGTWATVGTDYATSSGGSIIAYTDAGGNLGDGGVASDPARNFEPSGAQTSLSTAKSFNSLNFSGAIGATLVSGGALTLTSGNLLANTTGTMTGGTLAGSASGDLLVNTVSDFTIGSSLVNNGGATTLTKLGSGTLTLSGANAYTGATTVKTGTLAYGAADVTADAAGLVVNGGTLSIGAFSDTVATLQLIGGGTINGTSGVLTSTAAHDMQSGTVSAILGGTAGFTKSTAGTVTLTGANTYSGTTTISGGTLALSGGNNRLPTGTTVSFTGASTLNVGATSQTIAGLALTATGTLTGSGTLTLNASSPTWNGVTLDASGLSNFVYNNPAGTMTLGTTGNTTVKFAQTTQLTGAAINIGSPGSYTAVNDNIYLGQATTINVDTVQMLPGVVGSRSYANLYFQVGLTAPTLTIRGTAGGTSRANWTLDAIGGGNSSDGNATVDLTTGVTGSSLDAMFGTITIGLQGWSTAQNRVSYGSFTMGAGTLDATTIVLGSANSTGGGGGGRGTLSVSNGTVRVGTLKLADASSGNASQGTFDINGGANVYAQTIQNGVGSSSVRAINWNSGTIHNYDAGTSLAISGLTAFTLATTGTHTFDIDSGRTATINSALSGSTGTLVKNGLGTVTLTTASAYTGATTVSNGTFNLLGSIGTLTATGGGIFSPGTGTTNITVTALNLATGGVYRVDLANMNGIAGVNWDLVTASGAITLTSTPASKFVVKPVYGTAALPGFGFLTDSAWKIADGASVVGFDPAAVTVDTAAFAPAIYGGTFSVSNDVDNADLYLVFTANPDATPNFTWDGGLSPDGNWMQETNWTDDLLPGSAYRVTLTFTGNTGLVNTNDFAGGLLFGNLVFDSNAGAFTLSGNPLSLYSSITNNSANTQIVSNSVVLMGNVMADTATNLILNGVVSGAFGIEKTGIGALSLGGANTYTGDTRVAGGSLVLSNSSAIAASTLDYGSYGGNLSFGTLTSASVAGLKGSQDLSLLNAGSAAVTLTVGANNTSSTYGGALSGTGGGLTKSGSGTFTLSGASTYSGTTTLSAGKLTVSGASNRLPTGTTLTFSGASTLDVGANSQTLANLTFSANVTGTLTGLGGTLALTGSSVNLFGLGNSTLAATGLSNFTYNNSGGTLNATVASNGGNATANLGGTVSITAATFGVGNGGPGGSGTSHTDNFNLGQNNTINANNIYIGQTAAAGGSSNLKFVPGLTNPTLMIRGATGGSSRATTMRVGYVNGSDYANYAATVDLTTGVTSSTLDAMIGALTVGHRDSGAGSFANAGNGTFTFGSGTLDATSIILGETGAPANKLSTGNLTVHGGTVKVGTMTLGNDIGGSTATGNFTINSGAQVYAQTITSGVGSSVATINWNNGTIHNYDSSTDLSITSAVDTFALLTAGSHIFDIDSGRTATISAIMSDVGALTKIGTGTLTLNAANTYTGLTTVNTGSVLYAVSDAISTGDVTMNGATAVFDLGANHTDSIGTVTLQGGGSIAGTGTSALTSTVGFAVQSGSVSVKLAGAVALNKTTSGTVTLSSTNGYTGGTTVSDGELAASGSGALSTGSVTVSGGTLHLTVAGTIADSATLTIAGTGHVNVEGGINEVVNELWLNGIKKWPGTWGNTGSGAANEDPDHFTGSGVVTVITGVKHPATLVIFR